MFNLDRKDAWVIVGAIVCLIGLVFYVNYLQNGYLKGNASFKAERFCATKYRSVLSRVDEPDRMIIMLSPWEESCSLESYRIDDLGVLRVKKETAFVVRSRIAEKMVIYKNHPRWNDFILDFLSGTGG
jgi:hypothetical protein